MMTELDIQLNNGITGRPPLLSRLLSSLPAATFEMETFARLAGVVTSHRVPTAAMECRHRPRLLINPDFVKQYCQRDEHLFMLVMHELWHVVLAHTSLYPRVTQAQNIAFDAIINAGLTRQFNKPEYRGFFEKLNPADQFPHLLLRPPVGWSHDPQYPDVGPAGTQRVLKQLYPPSRGSRSLLRRIQSQQGPMPFYQEVLDLIRQDMRNRGIDPDSVVLLGDHDPDNDDSYGNTYLRDVMGRVVEKWPLKPGQFGPPGRGGNLNNWQVDTFTIAHDTRRAFSSVLRQALGRPGQMRHRQRQPVQGITGMGVLPNPRDRMLPARRHLGMPTSLWSQPGEIKARIPDNRIRANVYLDVSGSMSKVLPYLLNLLLPYVMNGKAHIYQFSTQVHHLTLRDLRQGIVQTTGGTSIQCVMNHLLQHPEQVRKALILTDGYTGQPTTEQQSLLGETGQRIHVVLPAESPYQLHLQDVASSITVLPPVG